MQRDARRGSAAPRPARRGSSTATASSASSLDGFLDDRHYISPPSDTGRQLDPDDRSRDAARAPDEDRRPARQAPASGAGLGPHLDRRSRYFRDATLTTQAQSEDLTAMRTGGMALATQPIGKDAPLGRRRRASITTTRRVDRPERRRSARRRHAVRARRRSPVREEAPCGSTRAAGVAIPFGVGADPWPEAKLVGEVAAELRPARADRRRPAARAACRACASASIRRRQSRRSVPRSREHRRAACELRREGPGEASRSRRSTSERTARCACRSIPADMGKLVNLGKLSIYGVDTRRACSIIAVRGCRRGVQLHQGAQRR